MIKFRTIHARAGAGWCAVRAKAEKGHGGIRGGRTRRGGILLEVLLAVALFAGAAATALACVKSVFAALDRTRREQTAVDLARSKMAQLEAGLVSMTELRGQSVDGVGVASDRDQGTGSNGSNSSDASATRWIVETHTRRTEFTNLSLVELTVREDLPDSAAPFSYTLRQLVNLKPGDAEAETEASGPTRE
jgi:hypothetical protein